MSIYVRNLPHQITEENAGEVFAQRVKVSRIQVPTDRKTGKARLFSFVEMESEEE